MSAYAKSLICFVLVVSFLPKAPLFSQVSTATPAPAILVTATLVPSIAPPKPTQSPSNTPFVGIQLEARDRANVRSAPDVASELLGEISSGEHYPVLGRFFRWLQFEYRFGPAWVFEELVVIHGDSSQLPEIDLFAPVALPGSDISATLAIVTQTPGGLQTATARAQFIDAPATSPPGRRSADAEKNLLPTFTFPPQFDNENNSNEAILLTTPAPISSSATLPNEIPPIIPIAILAGLGFLGLLIAVIRR